MNASAELMNTAAQWFLRARAADAQSEEYAAWLAWMEADPAHRRAFEDIQETWDLACSLEPSSGMGVEEPVVRTQPAPRMRWFAIAACVPLVILGVTSGLNVWKKPATVAERIATSRGEHHAAALPDGSRIELGGLTGIDVVFTPTRRLIVADEGEVFYKVHRDPKRPFVVKTGNVLVTAIGTAFSVRREAHVVSVAVEEGVVEVNAQNGAGVSKTVRAQAGERIQIDAMRPESATRLAESQSSAGWAPGKLRFEGEPLAVVVASLNRYSDREIMLGDPTLASLQFSGTIFDDRIDHWLEGVQHLFPIELRHVDSRRVVLERRPSGAEPFTPAR